jgi:hypothetical protein
MTTTTKKRSHRQIVREHLQTHGYITELVARNYGVRRLSARILDLKDFEGMEITSELRQDDNGTRYAYYTLAA